MGGLQTSEVQQGLPKEVGNKVCLPLPREGEGRLLAGEDHHDPRVLLTRLSLHQDNWDDDEEEEEKESEVKPGEGPGGGGRTGQSGLGSGEGRCHPQAEAGASGSLSMA